MAKKTRKFAGGGAMGSAEEMGKSLAELTGSLGAIQQGLTGSSIGNGGRVGIGALLPSTPEEYPDYTQPFSKNMGSLMGSLGLQANKFKKGGTVSASKRGDGIAQRGKTRGKMC